VLDAPRGGVGGGEFGLRANNLQRHEQQVHYPTIEPKAIEYYWT
jgi:hypothetical protein